MGIDWQACGRALVKAGYPVEGGVLIALFALAAGRKADAVIRAIGAAAERWFPAYDMTSAARIGEFVAQTAHETGGFTRFEENLNYSARGLAMTWPSRFAVDPRAAVKVPNAAAKSLARKPEAIANSVYSRPKEGNTHPGDGWRYRGRGMIQLTFRNNYAAAAARLGIDLVARPELAAEPATSLRIALDYWQRAEVNACCDAGDFYGARGITNTGSRTPKVAPIGLEDVARRRKRLMAVLSAGAAPAAAG